MFRLALTCLLLTAVSVSAQEPRPLKILFLGDDGHHRPVERFRQLEPVLAKHNITLVYTDKVASLSPKVLAGYDGLAIYANQEKITQDQEKSLLDYVESGKGLIPLHCASFCFLNSPKYVELVGAQFQKHGTGTVATTLQNTDHPILKNFRPFTSYDETYVHTRHNEKDRTVLEVRDKEPWTWTRTHGKGRVFYTAWGHDAKTWSNPGFHNLVERGIRWACNDDPTTVPAPPEDKTTNKGLKPFEYFDDVKVPFYPAGKGWGKTTEPLTKMQKPVEPAESAKHMVVPKGLKVELFAAEPLIYRPICMNWDEKGRLWIAETVDYPNEMKRSGEGRDRIVIVEDTNGDGVADKTTVFADKLSIPTSFAFANGGIVVLQAPDTLFLKDTNGDGVADERKVLFTGWNTSDTHAGPSNLVYGFDNWLYGIVGYAGFDGTVGGEKHSFRTGFFRMKPDGSKLEFLRNTNNNSWGVGFSEDGSLFGSTANGNASNHLPIPNRYYEKVRGWSSKVLDTIADSQDIFPITDRVRQVDHHGHFTAAAGHALYTARTYPKEYWNQVAFVTEPTGHLVSHFKIVPKGASYVAKNIGSFLASDDEWTSPIMAEVGPDGNVWVIDWYNYIIQHNPTPPGFKTGKGNAYETPLRDKTHGRVVRVVHPDGKSSPAPKLDINDPKTLIAALKHDNLFWRRHAQRLLVEKQDPNVIPELKKLIADPSVDEQGLNVGAVHALWVLKSLDHFGPSGGAPTSTLIDALQHKSPAVRRAAAMTMPRHVGAIGILRALPEIGNDPDPQVKLATWLMFADLEKTVSPPIGNVVRQLRAGVTDPWLLDAATCAAAARDVDFFTALKQEKWADKNESFAWTPVVERVANHYARGGPVDTVGQVASSLSSLPAPIGAALLSGLAKGWPAETTPTLSPEVEKAIAAYALATPDSLASLIQLNRAWKIASLDEQFTKAAGKFLDRARDEKAGDSDRIEAVQVLVDLRRKDPVVFKELAELLTPRTSPAVAKGVLDALGKSEIPGLGKEIVGLTPTLTPAVRPAAIRVLLTKPEWTRSLLDGLDSGAIASDVLSLDQKQALMAHPLKSLAARARETLGKAGGLPSPDRQKVVEELMPLTKETGDAVLGKAVFVQHCAKCHRHGVEGAKIGPDLTGMAVHPKAHLLVEIMDPNRSVEGNFRQYVVTTKAGRVLTGLLASESKTAIELIDSEAKTQTLQRDDIDELVSTPKSLMPEGFEKQLKEKDVVNLLTFLTQRGRYLPIPLGKAATTVSTRGMFVKESDKNERLIFPEWTPQTFEGIPFQLIDPQGDRTPNVILLAGPKGTLAEDNPKSVSVPCNAPAKAIHLLSGVGGWSFPGGTKGSVSMIVRLHYAGGEKEDHPLKNGEHFADYIRRVDVPGSKFAFALRGQQIRYLSIQPNRDLVIESIEFVKGSDSTAPVVMAVTVEPK